MGSRPGCPFGLEDKAPWTSWMFNFWGFTDSPHPPQTRGLDTIQATSFFPCNNITKKTLIHRMCWMLITIHVALCLMLIFALNNSVFNHGEDSRFLPPSLFLLHCFPCYKCPTVLRFTCRGHNDYNGRFLFWKKCPHSPRKLLLWTLLPWLTSDIITLPWFAFDITYMCVLHCLFYAMRSE